MDMFNKLKAKLAEEMDSETESAAGGGTGTSPTAGSSSSSGSRSKESLEKEIEELKEHINKNYFVYVKRLEKRKERIKEVEEYAKLLLKDNEALQEKAQEAEEARKQLKEARENLEELEGFRDQELAKVKHMLLSAETALEKETRERKRMEEIIKEKDEAINQLTSKQTSEKEADERVRKVETEQEERMKRTREEFEAKISRLEERLGHQDLSGDERLEAVIKERDSLESDLLRTKEELSQSVDEAKASHSKLESDLRSLEQSLSERDTQLSSVKQERDSLKSSMLELEIAHHEEKSSKTSDKEKLRMDMAKMATEKETLEVTLQLRDKELKAKKEEFRKELSAQQQAYAELNKQLETKSVRQSVLESELIICKEKLSEESRKATKAVANLSNMEGSVQFLEQSLQNKDKQVSSLKTELEKEKARGSDNSQKVGDLETTLADLNDDYDKMVKDLADATKERDEMKAKCEDACHRADMFSSKVRSLEAKIKESEDTFVSRVNTSDAVRKLRKDLQVAEDELADKRNVIKLHGQKMADMRRTFQKEMKNPSSSATTSGGSQFPEVASSPSLNGHFERMTLGKSPTPPLPPSSQSPTGACDGATMMMLSNPTGGAGVEYVTTTEFQYLKHVIFKFFTSREYEAKHLTRAIATLLKFTPDEEKLFQEHLDWKLSWFGTKPKLGSGQFALSIDPTS